MNEQTETIAEPQTTIKLSKKVARQLENLKIHVRETYEDVIKRLIKTRKT